MYFIEEGWRNDRLTEFGPAQVSNVETTECREE